MSRLQDKSTLKPSRGRHRPLPDEVGRIATTLAQLAAEPETDAASRCEPLTSDGSSADVAIETVRNAIRARRLRNQFFDDRLFGDPGWGMLLDLFEAELAQVRLSVTSLCAASALPGATALRWIAAMADAGLFERRVDPYDRRHMFVELSAEGSGAMRRYFHQLAERRSG